MTKGIEPGHEGSADVTATMGSGARHERGFPIVGLGASAGGLAAFEAFFSGMPADTDPGMAFVLVQHLNPDRESLLTDLIRRYTHLKVFQVDDGMEVEPDCAYVIPPGYDMVLRDGRLWLQEPGEARGHRLPIDVFFNSLAEEEGERAIGVVLSGTGKDGTLGVRALKARGGLVLAEDPDSTAYAAMPESAIAAGVVDSVLPAARIADWLVREAGRSLRRRSARPARAATPEDGRALQDVFRLLQEKTGHDFTQYKESSIQRRLERRMADKRAESLGEYVRYLVETPDEVEALFGDLLIGVTRFFRDPEAFATLEGKGIPSLLDGRLPGSTIRVWVPGCSTGEEAYSIAILLRERLDAQNQFLRLQIFATDIDPRAIETARAGVYPASIAEDVTAERLERFFSAVDGGSHCIHKSIRDLLIFSEQDLIVDPPFSRIDLISCRNLLIYLEAELQAKVMRLFHYALNPEGVLFLGASETVGDFADRFETVDRSAKLYRRKPPPMAASDSGPAALPAGVDRVGLARRHPARTPAAGKRSRRELTEHELLAHAAPAAALVDAAGEILYLHGRTGQFLEPAPGEMGMNILKMAREGLKRGLTTALRHAAKGKEPVRRRGLRVRTNGDFVTVNVAVRAVAAPGTEGSGTDLFLVTLEEALAVAASGGAAEEDGARKDGSELGAEGPVPGAFAAARIAALEEELWASEAYLKAVEEEMQTSSEEFRSTIEELQSTNEELQSTNEELETSKEELQSVSEELATINAELETKVADLSRAENDMNNLLAGTGIGTVFVDPELRIQRFTPAATELLNLIDSDVGRPVGDLTSRLVAYDGLMADLKAVVDTLVPRDVEVRTEEGTWYLLRIRPYRTLENVPEGAVITFTDITAVKEARETLRESAALRRLAVVVRDAFDAVTVQDLEGRVRAWNPGAQRMYGWTEAEALEMPYRALLPPEGEEEARTMLHRLLGGTAQEPLQTTRVTKDGRTLTVWVTATPLLGESGEAYALATTERQIQPRVREPESIG